MCERKICHIQTLSFSRVIQAKQRDESGGTGQEIERNDRGGAQSEVCAAVMSLHICLHAGV